MPLCFTLNLDICSWCDAVITMLLEVEHCSDGYLGCKWKKRKNGVWCLCWNFYHTHTHTRLTALFPGLPGWAGTRKAKPIWILLKQETLSGSGISWAICKSAPSSRQTTTPAPHHSIFLQAGCPSCRPTNSVKALKAWNFYHSWLKIK